MNTIMLDPIDMFFWSLVQPEMLKTVPAGSQEGLDWYWLCFLDGEVILSGLCNCSLSFLSLHMSWLTSIE